MPLQRSCKVFIQLPDGRCDLFWLNVTQDRSVVLGTSYPGTQSVRLILEEGQPADPARTVSESTSQNPKITFHYSGHYKVSAFVGKSSSAMDRCTIIGPKLSEIDDPRRMVEVILPRQLLLSVKPTSELDVILDARPLPTGPLRCTLWCCKLDRFGDWMRNRSAVVDTSTAEITEAFEDGERAWAFTLRTSRESTNIDDGFYFHIPGKIKWGQGAA